jgi:LEA14-like dessication related protein
MFRSSEYTSSVVSRRPLCTFGIAALFALLFAIACTSARPKIDPPAVTLESVRVLRIADAKASISLTLRLANTNNFDLAVDAVDLEVTLDGRPAANIRSVRIEPLPAGGETKVELAGRVDVAAVASALMTLGSQVRVEYALKGSATLRDGTTLPFSRKGEIPVARFGGALGARP